MTALRVLTAFGLMLLASACSPQPAEKPQAATTQTAQWSQETHSLLNDYRRKKGLPVLVYHQGLEQLCLDHSEWLRRKRGSSFHHGSNVSHSGSRARARHARIAYGMNACAENVAFISATPENVAERLIVMWKASPSHHKAMVGNWTHAATGMAVDDDGAIFATMLFGRKPVD